MYTSVTAASAIAANPGNAASITASHTRELASVDMSISAVPHDTCAVDGCASDAQHLACEALSARLAALHCVVHCVGGMIKERENSTGIAPSMTRRGHRDNARFVSADSEGADYMEHVEAKTGANIQFFLSDTQSMLRSLID